MLVEHEHGCHTGTFFALGNAEGSTWAVQQLEVRAEKPLIPPDHRGRFGPDRSTFKPGVRRCP